MKPAAPARPIALTLAELVNHEPTIKLSKLKSSGTDQLRPPALSSTQRFFNAPLRVLGHFSIQIFTLKNGLRVRPESYRHSHWLFSTLFYSNLAKMGETLQSIVTVTAQLTTVQLCTRNYVKHSTCTLCFIFLTSYELSTSMDSILPTRKSRSRESK